MQFLEMVKYKEARRRHKERLLNKKQKAEDKLNSNISYFLSDQKDFKKNKEIHEID